MQDRKRLIFDASYHLGNQLSFLSHSKNSASASLLVGQHIIFVLGALPKDRAYSNGFMLYFLWINPTWVKWLVCTITKLPKFLRPRHER